MLIAHGGVTNAPPFGTATTNALVTALNTLSETVHGSGISGCNVFEYKTAPVTLINLMSNTPDAETSAAPNVDKYGGGRF
jgi:hypothetical protein